MIARAFVAVLMAALLLGGCAEPASVEGTYAASGVSGHVVLTLGQSGKGTWAVTGEEEPFLWEIRGQDIWMHTRTGGVVTGQILDGGGIAVDLPGVGDLVFKKSKT